MLGIYMIQNRVNGKRYIGSAIDIEQRWALHRSDLNLGRHGNKHLQRSWDKHGPEAFLFVMVEMVLDPSKLIEREQWWIDMGCEYNMSPRAGSQLGWRHSDDVKAVVGAKSKEMWSDPDFKERKRAQTKAAMNRPEVREKQSKAQKATWSDKTLREKARIATMEVHARPGINEAMVAGAKKQWEENRERNLGNLAAARAAMGDKGKQLIAEATKSRWADPEYRAKVTAKIKASWAEKVRLQRLPPDPD